MHPDSKDYNRQVKVLSITKRLESIAVLIDSKKDSPDIIRLGITNHIRVINNFLLAEESVARSETK